MGEEHKEFSPSRNAGETCAATAQERRHTPGPWERRGPTRVYGNLQGDQNGTADLVASAVRADDACLISAALDLLDLAQRVSLVDDEDRALGEQLRLFAMNMRRDASDCRDPELLPYAESIEWFADRMLAHESIARAAIAKATSEPQPRAPLNRGEGSRDEPNPSSQPTAKRGE